MSNDVLLELVKQHIESDRQQFDALTATLSRVDTNVQSLLETRAKQRGAWKLAAVVATAASTLAGLVLTWVGLK